MSYTLIYWILTIAIVIAVIAITLFNSRNWIGAKKYLCDDCKYNNPQDCLKPERPTALECTAYRPVN